MNKQQHNTCILGLGERSTNFYTSMLHQKYYESLGDYHTFPFLLYQIDFDAINPFLPNQFDKLIPELTGILHTLSSLDAVQYLIPNITLHETLDKINPQLNFVHPVQLTIDYCKTHHIDTIVLFGSRYTMSSKYISNALKTAGINTISPSEEDQLKIDSFRTKTYSNSETESDLKAYTQLIQNYSNSNRVVTACTELSLHHEHVSYFKVVDMALLQIETILNNTVKSLKALL